MHRSDAAFTAGLRFMKFGMGLALLVLVFGRWRRWKAAGAAKSRCSDWISRLSLLPQPPSSMVFLQPGKIDSV
jgi:hypothetical protein